MEQGEGYVKSVGRQGVGRLVDDSDDEVGRRKEDNGPEEPPASNGGDRFQGVILTSMSVAAVCKWSQLTFATDLNAGR